MHAAPANVADWRERVSAFEDVGYLNDFVGSATLPGLDRPLPVNVGTVSGNLFDVLGVRAAMGRTFVPEETNAESSPVVLLSHGFWRRVFGGDPDVVGSTIRLDGISHQVIGVMPEDFRYEVNDAEVWVTPRWSAARRAGDWFRMAHVVRPVARLSPGVTHEQARAQLAAAGVQLEREYPQLNRGMKPGLSGIQDFLVGDRRTPLLLLMVAVGLLLMVACVNVANLLLVRSVGRREELAVRAALGAGRWRMARQLSVESVVLTFNGALLGLFLSAGLVR